MCAWNVDIPFLCSADVSLDEAFELYKKGLDEVKSANDMVQGMEKAMLVLNSDGQLEEF